MMTYKTDESAKALVECYDYVWDSELLKHEIAYHLGQIHKECTFDFLVKVLNDKKEQAVARHEAGEALANYTQHKERVLKEFYKHRDNDVKIIKSTIVLGISKLENYKEPNLYQKYNESIEPAEPMTEDELKDFLNKEGKSIE